MFRVATLCSLIGFSASLQAVELSGSLSAQLRGYTGSPTGSSQVENWQPSLALQPEFYIPWNDGADGFVFSPYGRFDPEDSERNHGDIREALWTHAGDSWEIKAGIGRVFWGVTESAHLVDVINQTDLVENLDGEDKLGQPLLNLTYISNAGTFSAFVLPGFRERTFPGENGRLRSFPVVDADDVSWESSAEEKHVDSAVRYSHYFGPVDIGLSHFHGTNREPDLLPRFGDDPTRPIALTPHYAQMDQTGVDLQLTMESWIGKFEWIRRETDTETFMAWAAGLEWTVPGIFQTTHDLGLIGEWLHDERDAETLFDDDLFVGGRWVWNDVNGTEVLAGVVADLDETTEQFWNLEASRRLNDRWTIELEWRVFRGLPTGPFAPLNQDDYIQLEVARYF